MNQTLTNLNSKVILTKNNNNAICASCDNVINTKSQKPEYLDWNRFPQSCPSPMRMSEFGNGYSKILKASKNQDGSSDKVHKLPAIIPEGGSEFGGDGADKKERERDKEKERDKEMKIITPKNENLKFDDKRIKSNSNKIEDSTNDDSYHMTSDSKLSKIDHMFSAALFQSLTCRIPRADKGSSSMVPMAGTAYETILVARV